MTVSTLQKIKCDYFEVTLFEASFMSVVQIMQAQRYLKGQFTQKMTIL